eukprot:380758_1
MQQMNVDETSNIEEEDEQQSTSSEEVVSTQGSFAILRNIKVNNKKNQFKPIKHSFKSSRTNKMNSSTHRAESLEAIIIQEERRKPLYIADMLVPQLKDKNLKKKLEKQKMNLLKKRHITPFVNEVEYVVKNHRTESQQYNSFFTSRRVIYPLSATVDNIEMSLKNICYIFENFDEDEEKTPFRVYQLCKMPTFRSIKVVYYRDYQSPTYLFEACDVVLSFEENASLVKLTMLDQDLNVREGSSVYIRGGISWSYSYDNEGGILKIDFINLETSYLKNTLEMVQDKHYYFKA